LELLFETKSWFALEAQAVQLFAAVGLLERDLVVESDGDGSYAVVQRGYQ